MLICQVVKLASVGQTDSTDTIKNFILDHQNDDGGWSWSTTGSSDSNDTAAAIMALLEVGVDNNSTEMTAALAYLKNTQNTDGGFAYDVAGSSDGASTAWVIAALNKIGSDSSAWEVSDNDPLSFLQSLEQEDGSYLWLPSDENGSAMVTAYALVALSGKFYPVNYIELEEEQTSVGIDLRIEGPDNTICLATALDVGTVLDVLAAGAEVCGYEYETQDSAYGVYVSSIDGIDAAGMDGWQYFINWSGGTQAAGDYQLSEGDDVLWAYGGWPLYAAKVEVNTTDIASNESLVVTATYFDGTTWQAQSGANIYIGDQLYQANSSGQLTIAMASDGIYPVWSQIAEQYTRSNKIYLIVGSGVSETVDLLVDIDNDTGGPGQDTIAFSVSQSSINFGTLSAGQSAQTTIALTNTGTTNIYIEASVIGDSVFSDYTSLNQSIWEDYSVSIARSNSSAVNVGLALPASLDTNGQKTGQLIFWAINN